MGKNYYYVDNIPELLEEINDLKIDFKNLECHKESLRWQNEELKKEKGSLKEHNQYLCKDINMLKQGKDKLLEKYKNLKTKYEDMKGKIVPTSRLTDKIKDLTQENEELKKEIVHLNHSMNDYDTIIHDLISKNTSIEDGIKILERQNENLLKCECATIKDLNQKNKKLESEIFLLKQDRYIKNGEIELERDIFPPTIDQKYVEKLSERIRRLEYWVGVNQKFKDDG